MKKLLEDLEMNVSVQPAQERKVEIAETSHLRPSVPLYLLE